MGFTVFLVLITFVCLLLIIVIMVQNPKGGGLSSTFGGSQQLGGVQKTTDFLDKSTWTLGIILIALILLSSLGDFNKTNAVIIERGSSAPAIENTTPAPAEPTVVPTESTQE